MADTVYYGILKDGLVIKKQKLEAVIPVPDVEFILKAEESNGNYLDSIYTLINADGSNNFLRIGDIELRDIGIEVYQRADGKRYAITTFHNYKTEKNVQVKIWTGGAVFLKERLIPLMHSLNETVSEAI